MSETRRSRGEDMTRSGALDLTWPGQDRARTRTRPGPGQDQDQDQAWPGLGIGLSLASASDKSHREHILDPTRLIDSSRLIWRSLVSKGLPLVNILDRSDEPTRRVGPI